MKKLEKINDILTASIFITVIILVTVLIPSLFYQLEALLTAGAYLIMLVVAEFVLIVINDIIYNLKY